MVFLSRGFKNLQWYGTTKEVLSEMKALLFLSPTLLFYSFFDIISL